MDTTDNRELCSYSEYLRKAQAMVEGSPLWKRFIDGTPLSNDIAVWMVEFMYANPEPGFRGPPFSDTPRTDAEVMFPGNETAVVRAEFAQELERELVNLR